MRRDGQGVSGLQKGAGMKPNSSSLPKSPRPPAERGQGRKSLQGGKGKSPSLHTRVTPELKARAERNGPQWVRDTLTAAPDPQ